MAWAPPAGLSLSAAALPDLGFRPGRDARRKRAQPHRGLGRMSACLCGTGTGGGVCVWAGPGSAVKERCGRPVKSEAT